MTNKLKILFLDIDGVLNSGKYIISLAGGFDDPINQMDPVAVARLNTITDATGAKIVVSSTWRLAFKRHPTPLDAITRCFRSYGITGDIIGMTIDKANAVRNCRGKEIQAWLDDNHGQVDVFVIIDDNSDMGRLLPKLIQTKFEDGLQDEHVEAIIDLLGRK